MMLRRVLGVVAAVLLVAGIAAKVAEPVDLNRATVAQLMTVPGMTEVWARRIVRFRPYRAKNDLLDRGVVTPEVYGRIRDWVAAHRDGARGAAEGR